MKCFLTTAYVLLATLFFAFKPFSLPVNITGHIKKNPKDSSVYPAFLTVFVKGDKKILAKSFTDSDGNFKMTFTSGKEKSFDFFCTGVGIDTLFIKSVTTFDSDMPDMTFYVPCIVKRNALGKVICPKCNQADKVFSIEYGDPTYVYHISKAGDTTYSPFYKGMYQAGTDVVEPAKYYCDRDKIKF